MLRSSVVLAAFIATAFVQAQSTYDAKILEYTGLRYACEGSGTPVLKIQNAGSATMGTCVVETWKNGLMQNSFNWVLAAPALTGEVRQPALPPVPALAPGDELEFRIISVNGEPDQDAQGNIVAVDMNEVPSLAMGGSMEVRVALGDEPGAVTWSVTNSLNQVVASGGPYDTPNSEVVDDLNLPPGCYTFKSEDISRSNGPDAVVAVVRAGNTLIVANDLSVPYRKGLKASSDAVCGNPLTLEARTDAQGSEVRWEVLSADGTVRYCASAPYADAQQIVTSDCCVPDGCYRLVVTDDGGDGIAGGGYVLREGTGAQRRIIDNGGNFLDGGTSAIANNEGFCLPLGSDRMAYLSCDKTEWRTAPCNAEYLVLNPNAAVSAEYGNSNAGSGYQVWWFDPNGVYSFKRFQSHNTTNGMPAGATRACHFRVNGWSGNQLQEGVLYNVKARGRVNGDYLPWGAACRFAIDNAAAQCPRTKLLDAPDNPFLSCGQTRAIGSNVYVHARPVKRMLPNCTWQSATRYQFRFRIPAEGFELVKTSATGKYLVNTTGLACGKTYEVDVRASFDNGATWCQDGAAWGDVCLLTTVACVNQGMVQDGASSALDTPLRLELFPNPSDGGAVALRISAGFSEALQVEVRDAAGRLVHAQRFAASDGPFTGQLVIPRFGAGTYWVSVRTGDALLTERLLVH